MSVTVRTRDTGYKDFVKRVEKLGLPKLSVGVNADDGAIVDGESGLTVAEIAAIHEFGDRSWLRGFVDEHRERLLDVFAQIAKQSAEGADVNVMMERFGAAVVVMIKKRIEQGISPPLTEATKAEKRRLGSATVDIPLIRFGRFIAAITHEITPK